MKINRKVIIFAILAGIIVVGITYSYMNTLKLQKPNPIKYIEVVSALNTIPARTTITEDLLEYQSVPESVVNPDAVLDSTEIIGNITTSDIYAGEQVLKQRILTDPATASLSFRVKENMRAMTIPISEVSGIAGYPLSGDRIDIIVAYTSLSSDESTVSENTANTTDNSDSTIIYTQFQNIEIMEVGINSGDTQDSTTVSTSSFTIMVSPAQAEVLAYALMNGSIQCTLRNPVDNVKAELEMFGDNNFNTWRDR